MRVSLYRREGTANWWMRYRDQDGVVKRRSTGAQNEAAARQIADDLESKMATVCPSAHYKSEHLGWSKYEEPEIDLAVLGERINRLENLLLSIVRHQAKGQELAAKAMAQILRQLTSRIRQIAEPEY